ncbi:MAG: stage II sporulation protein M [Undibacterium sp.]|nr:stage II sporulation protein M [Undibacterium sp.]
MKQKQFEDQNQALWTQISAILEQKKSQSALGLQEFPALYRRLCQNLALTLQRGYSPALSDYLQHLVSASHQLLYGTVVERPMTLHNWLLQEFPRRVREEWRLLLWVSLAFWGVAGVTGVLVWLHPDLAYSFSSPQELEKYRQMYTATDTAKGRGAENDFVMFGFYIWNNVSIDFRTFGAGVLCGIPALLAMAYNGMHGGVIAAWLSLDPVSRAHFWPFVATHSSFEITGMLLAGVAGMRLGLALLHPGRLSRRHAVHAASGRMFPIIVGAAVMTFIAAFFEAFWSANPTFSDSTKYIVAAICWTSVLGFLIFSGRTGIRRMGDRHAA